MRIPRTFRIGLVAVAAIGVIVLWLRWRGRPEIDGAAESDGREEAAQFVAEPVRPPATAEVVEVEEPATQDVQATRVELPRDPSTVGPRKTHAKVELVCGLTGTQVEELLRRIQVRADSDEVVVDESATDAVFAARAGSGAWVADVTPLVVGVSRLPRKLRVVAESERCIAFADVALSLTAQELAAPSLITLSTRLNFNCPWVVRGRVIAPCASSLVRCFGRSALPYDEAGSPGRGAFAIQEDGRFEWRTDRDGPQRLIFTAPNTLPSVREFEIVGQADIELGDVVLEPGAAVSGQLLAAGRPLANADVALVPADERISIAAAFEGVGRSWESSLSADPILRRALSDLGLLATSGGSGAPIATARTNSEGHFNCGSLRAGDHWVVVLSVAGQPVWLAPARFPGSVQDFVHEFEATYVHFTFDDAQGKPTRAWVTYTLDVRMPDGERVRLASQPARFGEVYALVQPGSLLELHACEQEVIVPVGFSTEPIVRSVSPCTKDSSSGK